MKFENNWIVKIPQAKYSIASFDKKEGAIDYAKNMARRHRPCKVEIYHSNGNFEDEYVFGLKPFPGE